MRRILPFSLLVPLLLASPSIAERPVTDKAVPRFEEIDKAILDFMELIDAQAATVAISRNGQLLYARGYGWRDKDKKTPTPPDTLFRIASVSKPITAAIIKELIAEQRLTRG